MPSHITIKEITHDLRNMKVLTNEQISFIFDLSNNEKNDIIKLYNEVFKYINVLLDDNNHK